MINESQIKEKLQELAKNEFRLSESDDLLGLIPEMLSHIGSTDSYLRDDLIYSAFGTWILDHHAISHKQLRELLQTILSDKYIFHNIGERDTDSVFRRSFSILLLPLILIVHRSQSFLTLLEIQQIKEKMLFFLGKEQDFRGFVNEKGWAHSIAHSADVLDDLVQCSELSKTDLIEILEAIRNIVCIKEAGYIYGEDERIVTAVIAIIKRGLITETEFVQWVRSFAGRVLSVESTPEKYLARSNVKNFLQSLYFRLDWEEMLGKFSVPINQTLQKISLFSVQNSD